MTKFIDYLKEQLEDPGFRSEYEALEPGFAIILAETCSQSSTPDDA